MGLIEHLKREIKKSGYPLEIEISSLLDKKWEAVTNTDSYYDSDEGKIRDIDISATRWIGKELPLININLVVECKRDDNFAWVFFMRPFKFDYTEIDGQYLDGLQILTKKFDKEDVKEAILGKAQLHYSRIQRVAVCFDEFYIKGEKTDYGRKKEIFEAETQLKKYILYSNEQLIKSKFSEGAMIYFPCIVFDGLMFEAEVLKGRVNLTPTKHVLISTMHRASYSVWDLGFLIDVVQKSHFERFMKSIDADIASISKMGKNNEEKILESISDAQELIE